MRAAPGGYEGTGLAAAELWSNYHEFYLILMHFVGEAQENLDVWERRMCPSVLIRLCDLGPITKVLAL